MTGSDPRAFVCPACGEQMSVSPATQKAVLQNGCPFCTDAVEERAFVVS
jgi:transcription elongation factor Elf1